MALNLKKAAGKHIFRSKPCKFFQHVNISTEKLIPCPYPTPLTPDYFKKHTTAKETLDFITRDYNPPTHSWSETFVIQVSQYAPLLHSLTTLAAVLAANHLAFMTLIVYKEPDYIKGISHVNFHGVCGIANFVFSPAKSIANYKDLFLDEIKVLRKEGTRDLKSLSKKKIGKCEVSVHEDMMMIFLEPCFPGQKFQAFVCLNKMVLIDDRDEQSLVILRKLPKFSYRHMDVSASLPVGS